MSVATIGLPDTASAIKASASRSPRLDREAKVDGSEVQDESFENSLTRADRPSVKEKPKETPKEPKEPAKASKKESKSAEKTGEEKTISAKPSKKTEDEESEETKETPPEAEATDFVVAQSLVSAVATEEVMIPQTDSAGVSEEKSEMDSVPEVSVETGSKISDLLKTQGLQPSPNTSAEAASRPEVAGQNQDLALENAAGKNRQSEKIAGIPQAASEASDVPETQDIKAPKDFSKILQAPKHSSETLTLERVSGLPVKETGVESKAAPKVAAPVTPFDTFVKTASVQNNISSVRDVARAADSFSEIRSVATQVREALGPALHEKKNEISIRLDPAEWGQVDVKLRFQKDEIQVQFTAQHSFVKDALERGLSQLRHSFQNDGLSLGQVSVGLGGETGAKDRSTDGDAASSGLSEEVAAKTKSAGVASRVKSSLLDMTA